MPTLDELNTRPIISATPDSADLIPFYDVSEFGNAPVKKTTVSNLTGSLLSNTVTLSGDQTITGTKTFTSINFVDGGTMNSAGISFSDGGGLYLYTLESPGTMTANRSILLPDVGGTAAIVPAYVDLTAANAALDSGDFWWDSTLNKLRQATA